MKPRARKWEQRLLGGFLGRLVINDLRRSFADVRLIGALPDIPPSEPVVLYANHHSYHDGYLGWYTLTQVMNRRFLTWMQEWDRYPLFAPLGALPFPEDEPSRRVETIRRTVDRLRDQPQTAFLYFPEGRLHAPQEGLLPFDQAAVQRLSRVFPPSIWSPMALHVTSWGGPRPVALLAFGKPHRGSSGSERDRLEQAWNSLRATAPGSGKILLSGRRNAHERWHLNNLARYFERFL